MNYVITPENVQAIDDAITVLRDRIQARASLTETALNEERSALAGLLTIFPKKAEEQCSISQ